MKPKLLLPDRSGAMHDPLEVAEWLDGMGDRSGEAIGESFHDAADVMRGLVARASIVAGTEATPWPLADVLDKLAAAADHLLRDHDCDAHGYEGILAARDAARRAAAALRASLAPAPKR